MQPPFHFFQTDRFLTPAFRDDGEIMKILHELLVFFQGYDDGLPVAVTINDVLLSAGL